MRIVAQNILKNNNYLQKYHRLDAQLSDMIFQYVFMHIKYLNKIKVEFNCNN